VMTAPLILLAVGAASAGLLSLSTEGRMATALEPVVGAVPAATGGLAKGVLVAIATVLALAALAIAFFTYASGAIDWLALRVRLAPLQRLVARGWYVDDTYAAWLATPGKAVAAFTAYVVDVRVIDGAVNGLGTAVQALAGAGRRVQTGAVRNYGLFLLAGAVAMLVYVGFRL
jgi:NADH-quinone oxidoreductase subunit L